MSVKGALHQRLLDELDRRNLLGASEETLTEFVASFVDEALQAEDLPLNADERRRLVDDLLEETLGVGPLAPLMADPAISDILSTVPSKCTLNGSGVWKKPTCDSGTRTIWCASSSGLPLAWAGGSTKARQW